MVSTEHLLTATEVARRCGLSLQGVTTAVYRGHLPVAVKFGDRRLYHREDVDRWRQNVARQRARMVGLVVEAVPPRFIAPAPRGEDAEKDVSN